MNGNRSNRLIVIENERLTSYSLDDRLNWNVGRGSGTEGGQIRMSSPTVSRQQGSFRNMAGVWFYVDHNGKNGTFLNGRKLLPGLGGREKPILLKHKDILLFGVGKSPVIDSRTALGIFLEYSFDVEWRAERTTGWERICFSDGKQSVSYTAPEKGTVIGMEEGMAVCMGEIVWLNGRMHVTAEDV